MKRILTVLAALLPLLAFAADRQEARLLRFPAVIIVELQRHEV